MIGVSSCLAGINCTYRGNNNLIKIIKELVAKKEAVMICPEVLGGLGTPRNPCEIRNGKVIDINGKDRTKEYELGAKKALNILQQHQIEVVLLKANSPSCGKDKIYDGSFTQTLINGEGITCQLLEKHGIIVFNEHKINEFFKFIEQRRKENGTYIKG